MSDYQPVSRSFAERSSKPWYLWPSNDSETNSYAASSVRPLTTATHSTTLQPLPSRIQFMPNDRNQQQTATPPSKVENKQYYTFIITCNIIAAVCALAALAISIYLLVRLTAATTTITTTVATTVVTTVTKAVQCNMSTNQMTYATGNGSSPQFLAEADVNSDGKLDIIVANSVTGIGVLLNNGSGALTAQTIYSTSNWSMSVAAVDVNNDGKPDIIVANNLASNVGVLLNTGSGTFFNQTIYPTGSNSKPFCLVALDINSDGKPDIVVSNNYDNNIGVFLNTGNGTFANQATYPTDSSPKSIAAADVNGDGKPDIIVANYNASNIGVLLNTGSGTFTTQTTYSTGAGSFTCSVAVADLNGDSKLDIIVANYITNNVGVFLNTGTGTFYAQTTYSTGSSSGPFSVAAADINNDGKLDIIVANYNANNVGVLLNTGAGTFLNQTTYSTGLGSGPAYVAAADINGDSRLDIIVTNYLSRNVGVFLSSCA